jgi:hypothetical protein
VVKPNDTSREPSKQKVAGSADLSEILVASLEALATAGRADTACRLAGRACAVLRGTDTITWHRFNVLLHRLTRSVS